MEAAQFNEALKSLEHLESGQLSQVVVDIKQSLDVYQTDYGKLGQALYRLCEQVMRIKDVKSECVQYYEDLICTAIRLSLQHEFRVGFDAMRFVFNVSSQFYKTADLDLSLVYPIGRDHPLKQYLPEVGQQCDVVRPYITSTSFCGWTRCVVLQAENNKYTFKYNNCNNPNNTREKPWFAPLGSRTTDYDWRMALEVGSPVEALLNRVWYKSTIAEVGEENGMRKVRVTYRRFAEDGDRVDSQGNKFFGLGISEDEWIDVLSSRIQKCGKMADTKLCYYTATSEEILLDDSYDILFEEEYKKNPFYGIMRVISCKSLSFIKFVDTFVAGKGIEKTLQVMNNLEINDEIAYAMLANIGAMVPFFPRMFIKNNPLLDELYQKISKYFLQTAKTLTPYKIDFGYFCYDMLGRRLFSLSEVYAHQNQLRKGLIRQFLKMNMEKQMLALRYLNDLINPKKPYSEGQREAFNKFVKDEKIFQQIFNANTHEQIISRTITFLEYLIQSQIISLKEFESLWKIVPATDTRGRAMIQKLLTQISKKIPITYVQFLISKILSLKQTELTPENLNLLKELKNRNLGNEMQMKILSFLWDILTVKSGNVKESIEEEVEKVFKGFVSTIKNPNVRMSLLESMCQKLQDCKRVKNEIQLLKDFIKSYPEKHEKTEMQEELSEKVPLTIIDAVTFIKNKGIYLGLLNLLSKTKEESIKKDILQFFGFLFDNDFEEIDSILQQIYQKLGPSVNFLEWIHKLLDRSLLFATEMLEKTTDFSAYQKISEKGFEAIQNIIIDVNKTKKNINIVKTYEYKSNQTTANQSVQTAPDASQKEEKKDQVPFIGPVQAEVKTHFSVLVSPFKLVGMKFLEHLLLIVKDSRVFQTIIKLMIQFISNLDQSIESKTQEFRREFLQDIIKEITTIVQENKFDDKVKAKLTVYLNLFEQIFAETQKNGYGDIQTHFEKVEGQFLSLNIESLFQKAKNSILGKEPRFVVVCNQNFSLWKLKQKIGQVIQEHPANIDIIKYSDPMPDSNNSKYLSQLLFYDNESIKIQRKTVKAIPKANLINNDGTDVSEKFEKIIKSFFEQYKHSEVNGLRMQNMEALANQKWRGSLFKQKDKLQKMFEEHDKEKKGYLSYQNFKEFFYTKSIKNQAAIWRLINLSGFKNNLAPASSNQAQEIVPVNTDALPRKILSNPQVYDLIFTICANDVFKDCHLNFFKLLQMLEVDKRISAEIQNDTCKVLSEENTSFKLCYITQVLNSELSKKGEIYFNFWRNNGLEVIEKRIAQNVKEKIPYELPPIVKFGLLPNLIKIQHMYVRQVLSHSKVVRYVSVTKINHLDPPLFVKKITELKIHENLPKLSQAGQKLRESNSYENILRSSYSIVSSILHSLMTNYTEKTQYLQRLTVEVVRLLGCIICTSENNHNFKSLQMMYGVKSGSLNYRRSSIILNYIYLFYSETPHPQEIEQIIIKLLEQLPKENKFEFQEYFMMLNEMISRYLQLNGDNNNKDQYFINLGNHILDIIFNEIQGQTRTSYSSDKIVIGILSTIETLIKKDSICRALSKRKGQITQKCLFAYDIQQKLQSLQITPQMLTNQKQAQHFKNYVICKTENSRETAYRIVGRLHELSEADDEEEYLNKYILPVLMNIQSEVRLSSSKSMAVGLKNFGSTCYMNSMLQVLNNVGPFRNSLMNVNSELNLIKELKKLFAGLYFSERLDYAPGDLLAAFVPPINPGLQQDTTQFLNFLFDQLESGLTSTRYKKLLDELFKGANTVQMICHSCGYKKQNREEFFSFGVEIEGKHDLYQALQGSFQGQIISDYLCDSCKNRGQTTKRNLLSEIPSVMFIHLRRIVFNYDMFVNMKIHTRLQFPSEMSIQPYTKEGVELRESFGLEYMKKLPHDEEEMKKFQKLAEHGKQPDYYKLKLKGVIVHSGSADVGHYYSVLQIENHWRKYDDSRVSMFSDSDFDNFCYGGTFVPDEWGSGTSANAYVLVYEKVVKNPIEIMGEGDDKEVTTVKYDDFKVHNSPEYYRQSWLDNHNFMVESQLLDARTSKIFINFACKLLTTSTKCENKVEIICQLLYRICFHSGYIGDLIKILLSNIPSVTPAIFYTYVLKDKARTFKLLFHYERPIRDFMATFLQITLLESFKNGDEKVKLDVLTYITEMLNAMSAEVAKNWMRIDGYFKLLYLLVSSSITFIQIWNLFMSRSLISTLIDFVMEKQSPVKINPKNYSLGTKSNPMDFFYGLSTILFLLKHSYGLTGRNYEASPIPPGYLFHLNKNDVSCLSHMEFYRKMLRERQNWFDLAGIIHRLCIQNLQFSKAICEIVMEAVNSVTDSKDEMADYSNICLEILKVNDGLWINRAQMLLGVGLPCVLNQNLMTTFDEERFFFTSTIYDIFPIQCLFSYSYLYRLKNTLGCFQLIRAIIQGCSINKQAIRFLAIQPSPTYLYPNLISWMESFIGSFLSYVTVEQKQKERLEEQIINVLKYVEDVKNYMATNPENGFYRSLITGEIVNKKEIHCFEKDGVQIKMYEYDVFCCPSKPIKTGGNLAMENYLQGFRLTKIPTDTSNILKFFKKPGKSIALKLAPIQEDQDKQIVGLFEQYSYPLLPDNKPKDEKDAMQDTLTLSDKEAQLKNKQSEKQKREKEKQKEEEINLEGVVVNSYFRQIEVVNKSKDKKVANLSFVAEENCNFIVPKNFSWKIFSKNNESLWMALQDYQKGWGNLQMKCNVDQYIKEKHEKKNITSWWFKTYESTNENINELPEKVEEKEPQAKEPEDKPEEYEKIANQPVQMPEEFGKSCPVCTYINPLDSRICSLCDSTL